MGRDVPGWVYRRQIEALERTARTGRPNASPRAEGAADPIRPPSRLRLSGDATAQLLNIDWAELRRLVELGRLEAHRGERPYDRWYLRSEIDAMVKASLRGHGPGGPDSPRRNYQREGTPIGYGVTLDEGEVLTRAASVQVNARGDLNTLNSMGNPVSYFQAGCWRRVVQALRRNDEEEQKEGATDGPR